MPASRTDPLCVPVRLLSSSPCISLGCLVLCYSALHPTEHGGMLNDCMNERTRWRKLKVEAMAV